MRGYFYNVKVHTERPKFFSGTIAAENGGAAFGRIIKEVSETFDVEPEKVEIVTLNNLG